MNCAVKSLAQIRHCTTTIQYIKLLENLRNIYTVRVDNLVSKECLTQCERMRYFRDEG